MTPSAPDVRNSDVNEAINQALCACNGPGCPDCNYEVASPETSTAQTGTTGMAAKASVDVPEKISWTGFHYEMKMLLCSGGCGRNFELPSSYVEITCTECCLSLESLADFSDEGETAWNAIRRAEVARKMQRIAAGGYNSVDKLIGKVEELAEVGQ